MDDLGTSDGDAGTGRPAALVLDLGPRADRRGRRRGRGPRSWAARTGSTASSCTATTAAASWASRRPTSTRTRPASCPADGVYAGWLVRLDRADGTTDARLPAAVSIGTNPTFDGTQRRVEAYVLDRTDLDLYGERVAHRAGGAAAPDACGSTRSTTCWSRWPTTSSAAARSSAASDPSDGPTCALDCAIRPYGRRAGSLSTPYERPRTDRARVDHAPVHRATRNQEEHECRSTPPSRARSSPSTDSRGRHRFPRGPGRDADAAHQGPHRAPQGAQARPPQPSWSAAARRPAPPPAAATCRQSTSTATARSSSDSVCADSRDQAVDPPRRSHGVLVSAVHGWPSRSTSTTTEHHPQERTRDVGPVESTCRAGPR